MPGLPAYEKLEDYWQVFKEIHVMPLVELE